MFPQTQRDSKPVAYTHAAFLCQSRLKLLSQVARPGADLRPVPYVANWHVFEGRHQIVGEGEFLRVELTAKDGNRSRRQPGKFRQLFIELLTHLLKFLLLSMKWAKRENGHWPLREGFPVTRQEMERVLVPVEH